MQNELLLYESDCLGFDLKLKVVDDVVIALVVKSDVIRHVRGEGVVDKLPVVTEGEVREALVGLFVVIKAAVAAMALSNVNS